MESSPWGDKLRQRCNVSAKAVRPLWVGVFLFACAMGVGEERADPPNRPPRLDGSIGGEGGYEWPEGGTAGYGAGGFGAGGFGAGGFGAGGFGAEGGEAGNGGQAAMAGAGGSTAACIVGESKVIGNCGWCGTLQQDCDPQGVWGEEYCTGEGVCEPNSEETAKCGNCGTKKRTCLGTCQWSDYGTCAGEGCKPGTTKDCLCSTNAAGTITSCCGQHVCDNECKWGSCGLKPTSKCDWNAGHTYRCCGTRKWEYCLSNCDWSGNCASCDSCCK